jgi:transcriptional regulator with XRE-family HTH domain
MDTQQSESVGAEIRAAREALNLSKRAAAQRAGVSEARWRQIENGVQYVNGEPTPTRTTAETLVRIVQSIGLDVDRMLDLAGFPPGAADVVRSTPPANDVNIVDLTSFPSQDAELIRTFIAGLRAGRSKNNT